MNKKTSSTGKVAGGLGLAALAATAAAGYYFFGEGGKQHRQKAAHWSKKAKQDMLEKIKGMQVISQKTYDQAAAEVLAKYKQAKNIDPKDLIAVGNEIKLHWNKIAKDIKKLGKAPAAAKKPASKKKTKK